MGALSAAQYDLQAYQGQMAKTQLTLQAIVSQFLPLSTSSSSGVNVEIMPDLRRVRAYLDDAANLAREEVITMHPGNVAGVENLPLVW